MSTSHQTCVALLRQLEQQMRDDGVWAGAPPAAARFESALPFMVDTLTFDEWLQFVFIPRLQALVDAGAELPRGAGLTPYAEVVFREDLSARRELLNVLRAFDALLSKQRPAD